MNKGAITVSEHVDGELRDFALYTIFSRAIPSMIDGFKPSQRKAVYTATQVARNKKIKTVAMTGYSFPISNFHHGDLSMSETIVSLAAPHSNNIPILEGEGTFGSRLVPDAASPRYTEVGLSKQFDKFFPDTEICPENPDPEYPEPLNYLPIIPWVLLNGVKGIATGFACTILPRSVDTLVQLCTDYMSLKPLKSHVEPSFPFFNGTVAAEEKSWLVSGTVARTAPTKVTITELPIGYDREKYIVVLHKLEDAGTILSFKDECSKKGFQFAVTLPRSSKNFTDEDLIKKLKLTKRYTDNLTVINQHGELKIYDTVADLVKDFCDYRLSKYADRYAYWIARDTKKRDELSERVRFCNLVLNGAIVFKNNTKKEVLASMSKQKFSPEHRTKFIDLPIHSITKDAIARLQKEILELEKAITTWKNIDIRKQYLKELQAL